MSAYSLLDALSFEIRHEIKLLEHFGNIKDHPMYLFIYFLNKHIYTLAVICIKFKNLLIYSVPIVKL
jgi:hypothetical protein